MRITIALLFATVVTAVHPASGADFGAALQWAPGQSQQAFQSIDDEIRAAKTSTQRAELQAGLLKLLLSEAHPQARVFAAQRLAYVGSPGLITQLRPLLLTEGTAGLACLTLSTMPPGAADKLLVDTLPKASAASRVQIINTLGDRRAGTAVKELTKWARTGGESEREAALDALGQIGTKPALQSLLELQRRIPATSAPAWERAMLRCAGTLNAEGQTKLAVQGFEPLSTSAVQPQVRRGAFAGLLAAQPRQAAQLITVALKGTDALLRPVAIQAIPRLTAQEVEAHLSSWRGALQPEESVWLIQAFAKSTHPRRAQVLRDAAQSGDSAQREAAFVALGEEGSPASLTVLLESLRSARLETDRTALQNALAMVPVKPEMDATLSSAMNGLPSDRAALLITALGRRGSPAHFGLILQATGAPEAAVARAAWMALPKVAQPAQAAQVLQALARTSGPDATAAVGQVLGTIEPAAARAKLVAAQFQATDSEQAKVALLSLLADAPSPESLSLLQANRKAGSPALAEAAREALLEYADPSAWEAVFALAGTETDPARKAATLRALARLAAASPAPENGARFKLILPLAGNADLRAILGAMGGVATVETLQLAVGLLDNADVRAEAKAAVTRIAEVLKKTHPEEAKAALARANAAP
jgi:HEAT repeat protein